MVAVLDLGSNSFILLVQHNGEVILEEVYEVGLKSISDEEKAFETASETILQMKKKIADTIVYAFGTAVFRERPALFEKIIKTFNLNGEILSEEDEAYFTYMSVDPNFEQDITVLDLGGGSLEIVTKDWFKSLPVGTHVLNSLFNLSLPQMEQFSEAVRYVEEKIPFIKNPVGVGGSFVTIAAMKLGRWDLKLLNGLILNASDVEFSLNQLKGKSYEQVRNWGIIPPGREKTIVAGCVVAMAVAKFGPIRVSTKGFRHTLASMIERGKIEKPWRARGDLNSRPPDPQSGALSS